MYQVNKHVDGEYELRNDGVPRYIQIELRGDYVTVTKFPDNEILLSCSPNKPNGDPRGLAIGKYRLKIEIEAIN